MKKGKIIVLTILSMILGMGVCGCMNHNEYSEKILSDLNQKYNKSFEIDQLTYEVGGDSGSFYRAVCREKGREATFVTYYYLNGTDYLLSSEINASIPETDNEPILVDEYCDMLLNEMFADYLISNDLGISYAITEILTVKYALTMEDVSKGIEYCLSNDVFDVKVNAYLFLKYDEINMKNIEDKILEKFAKLNCYRSNVDFIHITAQAVDTIENDYTNDVYEISEKIKNDENVISCMRYSVTKETGIEFKKIIKGE